MKRNLRPSFTVREQLPYRILVVFLVVVFLTGGGARGDIQSLLILRPLAIIVAGIGMLGLRWGHVRTHSFVFAGLAACYAFILLHALPLPPALWQALPGRELVVDIDRTVGLGRIWRPLSLAPAATWNAFFALFVPLAVAILAAQLSREQRRAPHRFEQCVQCSPLGHMSFSTAPDDYDVRCVCVCVCVCSCVRS